VRLTTVAPHDSKPSMPQKKTRMCRSWCVGKNRAGCFGQSPGPADDDQGPCPGLQQKIFRKDKEPSIRCGPTTEDC